VSHGAAEVGVLCILCERDSDRERGKERECVSVVV